MALFRWTLQKYAAYASAYWTNVYWIDAATLADAGVVGSNIVTAERPLYTGGITITNGRIDDAIEGTDQYITYPFNLAGSRANPASSEIAPLWVCARVDFGVVGLGRPSRKYLRGVLWETDFGYSALVAGMLTLLNTYGAAITALSVVDPDGQDLGSVAVWNGPQMRQLRRGSKKTVTP